MSFKIGIVGLPNVGKSTLFKALTKKQIDISNYPFCTIEPNVGIVEVPDKRLDKLAQLYDSAKIVPTVVEFVDIAGLVKNAHKGEGLGNKFLAHIREVDAIAHVVRDFQDENIIHVDDIPDPERDKKTIELELVMADLSSVEKKLKEIKSKAKSGDKKLIQESQVLEKIFNVLNDYELINSQNWTNEEQKIIKESFLITAKPMIEIRNISENDLNKINESDNERVYICAKLESELSELSEEEKQEYLEELGLKKSGLNNLILAGYKILNLITFFTAGPTEAHAWTIEKDSPAPKAAGKIHTDFEKGFIRAEIINWEKLLEAGGEFPAKEKGWIRTEGKNYQVQDGDTVYFLFNK